jgi:hypothetical protein
MLPATVSAYSFADSAFESVWQRTDKPVAEGRVARSWMWGPEPFTEALYESYAESPGGTRMVQYFDKSRMEINDPNADRSSQWFVTNGLLVREMVDGRVQIGDASFEERSPAQEAVAGDPAVNNPNCPTYASFTYLTWERAENRSGQKVTATLSKDATVGEDASKAGYDGTEIAHYEEATGHNVPQVLWDFMNARGLIYSGGSYYSAQVADWLFAMGYPISEPYWARCTVGGEEKDVLVQLFERRVLTYTPSNPAGWQVEMGNVGRHYHNWRYGSGAYNQPGLYTFEGRCTRIEFRYGNHVVWCIESVEVRSDGYMKFNAVWTAPIEPRAYVKKYSDVGNTNLYLRDNLGNRYHHVEVGGDAGRDIILTRYSTARGWYLFPPAQPGATSFIFHDDDSHVHIEGLVLQH